MRTSVLLAASAVAFIVGLCCGSAFRKPPAPVVGAPTDREIELGQQLEQLRLQLPVQPPSKMAAPSDKGPRKSQLVDEDGWPARRVVVTRERLGPQWPFRNVDEVTIVATLFGLAIVEVNGTAYALNDLADHRGYPLLDAAALKYNPGPPGGDFVDITPVRKIAQRSIETLKREHLEQPYELPNK